tara:strand:- start:291 stop:641 length:351 start_codon:yes stop_codon:yes gene_type:complete
MQSNYYKYDEIYTHFEDFIKEQLEYNKDYLNENDFSDIHHQAFNQDYYIIGRYQATKWLSDEVFNIIEMIKEYENDNFGEVYTDFSEPEKIVNMYTFIIGYDVMHDYFKNNKLEVA